MHPQGTITADPSSVSFLTASSALFASCKGNTTACGRILSSLASARKSRILTSHVRHTADLPLAPKQLVIVKRRHLIEMDCIDRNHSTLAQRGQGADDYLSTGSEGDRPVQLHGRLLVLVADPGCAQRAGSLAMVFPLVTT